MPRLDISSLLTTSLGGGASKPKPKQKGDVVLAQRPWGGIKPPEGPEYKDAMDQWESIDKTGTGSAADIAGSTGGSTTASATGGRGSGRVMEEGYWLERNPGKTPEDYQNMLLYLGGRGGDIGGGNFVVEEDGVPRNWAGETKPGWKKGKGGKGQMAVDGSAPKSGSLRRKIHEQKSLLTQGTE